MSNVLKQYCDGFAYEYTTSKCEREIDNNDKERCVLMNCGHYLMVLPWESAKLSDDLALHFHSHNCAKRYIEKWLKEKADKTAESVTEVQL